MSDWTVTEADASAWLTARIAEAQEQQRREIEEREERERIEREREQAEAIERLQAAIEPDVSERLRAALRWRYEPMLDSDENWQGVVCFAFEGADLLIMRERYDHAPRYRVVDPLARKSYTLAELWGGERFERDLLLTLGDFRAARQPEE